MTNPIERPDGYSPAEFPEAFLNLTVPGAGLLAFYRHSETRLLRCQVCEAFYLYQSRTADGRITETLQELTAPNLASELDRLEAWGRQLAIDHPEYFAAKLTGLIADCQKLRPRL